jgi:muconolactone delta-isomerase
LTEQKDIFIPFHSMIIRVVNMLASRRSGRREGDMKFLVLWHFELNRLGPEVVRAVTQMPDYAKKLGDKLECRYHVIGSHGGAWIYDVTSNEELDRLLAMSPVYNYASYQVLALAEMEDPRTVMGKAD